MIKFSLIVATIGLLFSMKAKKIFEKGLSESDSFRMVIEFNKSKRYRRYSTILLIISMLIFSLGMIEYIYSNSDNI
jgi:hypothetical protein